MTMLGLLTPQQNPTVEREMRRLLPAEADYFVGRLVSAEADPAKRLRAYAEDLPITLRQFGALPLVAILFACTGSSYLLGRDAEARIAATLTTPVIWATAAILSELRARGASRVAIVSPYPDALHGAALDYWRDCGFDIVFDRRVDIGSADTRAIYGLTGQEAAGAIEAARESSAELILLSGTGMPTLAHLRPDDAVPVISSNYCLARAAVGLMEQPR